MRKRNKKEKKKKREVVVMNCDGRMVLPLERVFPNTPIKADESSAALHKSDRRDDFRRSERWICAELDGAFHTLDKAVEGEERMEEGGQKNNSRGGQCGRR